MATRIMETIENILARCLARSLWLSFFAVYYAVVLGAIVTEVSAQDPAFMWPTPVHSALDFSLPAGGTITFPVFPPVDDMMDSFMPLPPSDEGGGSIFLIQQPAPSTPIVIQPGASLLVTAATPAPTPTPVPNPVSLQAGLMDNGLVAVVCANQTAANAWVNIYIDGAVAPQYSSLLPTGAYPAVLSPGQHTIVCSGYHPKNAAPGWVLDGTATPLTMTIPGPPPTPSPSPTATATPAGFVHDPMRPDNEQANNTVPSAAWLATFKAAVANGQGCPGGSHPCEIPAAAMQNPGMDPIFVGTTDQELAHFAGMCNVDPDWVRADAIWESQWHQSGVGDCMGDPTHCSSDGGIGNSYGILQIKSRDYPATCPTSAASGLVSDDILPDCMSHLSTPVAIWFRMIDWCNAKNGGALGYIEDGRDHGDGVTLPKYPDAVAAHNPTYDRYFMAIWGPGDWGSAGFWAYVNGVQKIYDAKPWLQPNFVRNPFATAPARHIRLMDAHKRSQ